MRLLIFISLARTKNWKESTLLLISQKAQPTASKLTKHPKEVITKIDNNNINIRKLKSKLEKLKEMNK